VKELLPRFWSTTLVKGIKSNNNGAQIMICREGGEGFLQKILELVIERGVYYLGESLET
jgi:hypothetical protein